MNDPISSSTSDQVAALQRQVAIKAVGIPETPFSMVNPFFDVLEDLAKLVISIISLKVNKFFTKKFKN